MKLGYALITEEHAPKDLIANAQLAEEVGFDYLSISDHFHPWLATQGHSPFAWTVLGAILHSTSLPVITQVTCPIKRYHPAIVAQAAATAAAMSSNRFVLGLGTGEALNENVVGGAWPAPSVRLDMLEEAIEIITALWEGEAVTRYGRFFTVDRATLYTLPDELPHIAVAVSGGRSIELAAAHGHAVSTSPAREPIEAYRQAGGRGDVYGQATVCFAADRDTAQTTMLERWRHSPFGWDVNAELATPGAFADATDPLPPSSILGSEPLGSDEGEYQASIETYREAGFDAISLHNVGREQTDFLKTAGRWFFS